MHPSSLHLLTYATDPTKHPYLHCPTIKNISPTRTWSGNFKDKLHALQSYLIKTPPNDIVCFVDAYDVICFAEPVEILEKFIAFKADVMFSAETSCYPWSHVQSLYPTTLSLYKFLNSGSYIGYVWALQKMLSLDMSQSPCDQGYLTYYYLNHVHDTKKTMVIELDRHCVLFQTAYAIPWSHFVVDKGRLHNTVMRTQPCFIHYNGQQHLMVDGSSIMPVVYSWIQDGARHTFESYQKKHEVVCNEHGVPLADVKEPIIPMNQVISQPLTVSQGQRDDDIIALALSRAKRFVAPDQTRILERDQVNYHAIFQYNKVVSSVDERSTHSGFAITNRSIIEMYLLRVGAKTSLLLDVSLHDYVGIQMNTVEWPHSILSFSTDTSDEHNILIPDLYAMQNYKSVLDPTMGDSLPTLKKTNKLLFIGVSSGKASVEHNHRVAVCQFARQPNRSQWIEAYISSIVNFTPVAAKAFEAYMRVPMTMQEQYVYRHILVIDGNTACWDRLAWVLASKCVCWKQESTDQCWYYPFLQPWVHYVPFTLETLEETWLKVRDDRELQLRMVAAANQFVEDFLQPARHALYLRTLLEAL